MKPAINLDVNASYGLSTEVKRALASIDLNLLNPNSIHQGGQAARQMVEEARDKVRSLLELDPHGGVIFTSGATESNNIALNSPFLNYLSVSGPVSSIVPECVTTVIEHPSVLEVTRRLEEFGVKIKYISPNSDGTFSPSAFVAACSERTKIVSVMHANNETGQVLDIRSIAQAVKSTFPHVLIHVDAVQTLGKLPVSLDSLGVDLISISGHKIGALSGVGALICRKGVAIDPFILGGPQELRRRAGTENVLGIYSFGIACEEALKNIQLRRTGMMRHRAYIQSRLSKALPWLQFNLFDLPNTGNTLSVTVPGVRTSDLVVALDLKGVLVSSGAACASGKPLPSHVLRAIGLSEDESQQTIRISVAPQYEQGHIEDACDAIIATIQTMKGEI